MKNAYSIITERTKEITDRMMRQINEIVWFWRVASVTQT